MKSTFRRTGIALVLVCVGFAVVAGNAAASGTTWTVTASPNQGSGTNVLDDVSCPTPTSCVAVGFDAGGSGYQTLIEVTSGANWSIVSSPDVGSDDNVLQGVSCVSATFCMAVGYYDDGSENDTLVESWDGSSWTVVPSPSPESGNDTLSSVSCTGTASCVAVGTGGYFGSEQTIVESFDGTSWSASSSPDPASDNFLEAVSCVNAVDCVAVGNDDNGAAASTLVESFNGMSWSVTPSPDPSSSGDSLYGVSCTSSLSCVAVGSQADTFSTHTLIESFDGNSWSVSPSPDTDGSGISLAGVSCATATSCVAAGYYFYAGDAWLVQFAVWNGSTWALVPGPGPNTGVSFAYGVSCSTTVTCVSVGYSDNENTSTEQTLVETESPAVPIVNAVSPNTGFTTGGTSVTITGSGFTDASEVDFNGVAATDVVVDNDSSITAVTPAESAGVVDVTVTTPGGLSTVSPADLFTYTVDASPTTVSCDPETPCSDSVNSTLDNTSVSVTGNPGASATGSESLVVNTDTLSCGSGFDYPTAVSTLSSSGFSPGATLTVTENVGGEPSTSGLKTCFEAAGSSTATILKACKHGKKFRAPCQQSLTESAGTATATLAVPANDPRFWVGGSPINLKSFSPTKGKVGSTVTLKGLNLTEVTSVVMGGVRATVKSSNAAKVVVIVPEKAVTGYITVTADSGSAVSALPFTVT